MPSADARQVLEQLERIVSSTGFVDAGRLAPFLRFLVERTLAGEPVKETVIGVEVFGRPADYDSRLDPIVRVEARRLRSRLAEYYAGPGAADPVTVDLPKGAYLPVFGMRESPQGARPPAMPAWRRWAFPGAVAAGALAVAALLMFFAHRPAPSTAPVVAVLPFVNMAEDRANEYFSDGLTEELIDRLAKAPGLRVVARSSTFQYKGRPEDLRSIGRKLNATAVVEGSVRRSGDRLRVSAQLIDVADGLHLWSETYDRRMDDVFAIQEEIARSIASALRVELRVGFGAPAPAPTSNMEAYELYLKGRKHLNRDALAGLELAAEFSGRAVAADPGFAAAHAQLALAYGLMGYYTLRPAADIWPKAKAAAERVIALNPRLGAGHAALGMELGMYEWKWKEAERSLRRAVELEPESADCRMALAVACLVPTGRLEEAWKEFSRALESDPQSYLVNAGAAYVLLSMGRYPEAIAQYRRAADVNPSLGDIQWDLGMAYALAGRKEDALRQFRLGGQIHEGGPWQPWITEYALLGDIEAARRRAASSDLTKPRPIFVAYAFGAMGDGARAAEWLEKAYAAHDPQVIWIKIDPRFAKVRAVPRVQEIIRKIGL